MTRATHRIIVLTCIVLGLPAAAGAENQINKLNRDAFIEGLRNQGMNELLVHLADVEKFDDPADAARLRIDVQIVVAQNAHFDEARRIEAAENALNELRNLIKTYPDHVKRPVWQTELSEYLLYLYVTTLKQGAAEFYQFGVPSSDQRKAFESAAHEAYTNLQQANQRFFQLQGDVPKNQAMFTKLQVTGQWDRMIHDFWESRTRFLLAKAAMYVSLLPDNSRYFQTLGNNPDVPVQKTTIPEERLRLLGEALDNVSSIDPEQVHRLGLAQPAALLTGLCEVGRGNWEAGLKALRTVNAEGLPKMTADLGVALAMDGSGETAAALDYLTGMTTRAPANTSLLYRLMVVDAMHRLKLRHAKTPKEIEDAYSPYTELFEDKSLGDAVVQLRTFVYRRWIDSVTADRYATAPSMVLLGIGQTLRLDGQNLMADSKRDEAVPKLEQALKVLKILLDRKGVSDDVVAQAMFNQGYVTSLLGYDEDGNLQLSFVLAAAKIWTDLADQFPGQSVAEEAIKITVNLLRPLQDDSQSAEVRQAAEEPYHNAVEVLLAKFPTSRTADDERLPYGFLLQRSGKFAEAVEVYSKLPPGHERYFEVQGELIYCLQQLFVRSEDSAEQKKWADKIREIASKVAGEVDLELQMSPPEKRAQVLRRVKATLLLAQAEIEIGVNRYGEAITLVQGFAEKYPEDSFIDMVRESLEKLIIAHIGAGNFDDAVGEARKMMQRFPLDAAAVIDGVLRRLDQEIAKTQRIIAQLRARVDIENQQARAKRMAQTANQLADLLLAWAKSQPNIDAQQMVPYQKIKAKALGLIGDAAAAVAILQPLQAQFPTDAGLLYAIADAYYLKGDEPSLIKAMGMLNDLIRRMTDQIADVKQDPGLREIWWSSWQRRLQIQDKLYELHKSEGAANKYLSGVKDIPLRVKQLERDDPNLGGDPHRSELERLRRKHSI